MITSPADIWDKVLENLKKDMTPTTIDTWFDDSSAVEITDTLFVIHTPSNFKKDIIVHRYVPAIQAALHEIFSGDFEVLVLGEGELEPYLKKDKKAVSMMDNDEFTFERFVVGNSNKFAHAAAKAVAEAPAQSYNPLFIYGDSGLGKTHLLYAIAHDIRKNNPEMRIVYIKGDEFTNELVAAIREGKNLEFRDKYRLADLFLVDDIQFIAGKVQTQEEFFHTFNTLYEAKKQIVLTSDRPPKEMTRLEDRLKTRFEWGLLADIQPPDYETRLAIIKNKASQLHLELSDAVVEYIAENISSNVRQIEGTVKKILAFRDLLDDNITVSTVSRAVRDMFKEQAEFVPSPSIIIDEICKYYLIEEYELRGQQRTKDTATARQIAMYLIRRMTNLSLTEIGKEFENRDHTTVMHSLARVERLLKTNPKLAETIKDITANINARNQK